MPKSETPKTPTRRCQVTDPYTPHLKARGRLKVYFRACGDVCHGHQYDLEALEAFREAGIKYSTASPKKGRR